MAIFLFLFDFYFLFCTAECGVYYFADKNKYFIIIGTTLYGLYNDKGIYSFMGAYE